MELSAIRPETFFTLPDLEALGIISSLFGQELQSLARAPSRPDASSNPKDASGPSPSETLLGARTDEVDRTLVSILALRWLGNDQYDIFACAAHGAAERLSRESFDWMRGFFLDGVTDGDSQTLQALVTSVVINDLGKDPGLARAYRARTGVDISSLNHDAVLLRAVDAGLVPCLDRLGARHRAAVVQGMRLGADFNFGQLAQAENAPASLAVLRRAMRGGEPLTFRLRFMEQLLDIAGAAGHVDWACARKMTEPVLQAYRAAHEATLGVVDGSLTLRQAYDHVLVRRAAQLGRRGFRQLDVTRPSERALMRLLCMGGVADLATADVFDQGWGGLEEPAKGILVRALNLDGEPGEPAVQPTYMPGLITQAVAAAGEAGEEGKEAKKRVLQSCLRYLARVMSLEGQGWRSETLVVERDVFQVWKTLVGSDEFRGDPTTIERAPVPVGTVILTVME